MPWVPSALGPVHWPGAASLAAADLGHASGGIAYVMVAYGNGVQGLEGIKYIGSAAGVAIFFLYILQIASAVKLFFGSRKLPTEL